MSVHLQLESRRERSRPVQAKLNFNDGGSIPQPTTENSMNESQLSPHDNLSPSPGDYNFHSSSMMIFMSN